MLLVALPEQEGWAMSVEIDIQSALVIYLFISLFFQLSSQICLSATIGWPSCTFGLRLMSVFGLGNEVWILGQIEPSFLAFSLFSLPVLRRSLFSLF